MEPRKADLRPKTGRRSRKRRDDASPETETLSESAERSTTAERREPLGVRLTGILTALAEALRRGPTGRLWLVLLAAPLLFMLVFLLPAIGYQNPGAALRASAVGPELLLQEDLPPDPAVVVRFARRDLAVVDAEQPPGMTLPPYQSDTGDTPGRWPWSESIADLAQGQAPNLRLGDVVRMEADGNRLVLNAIVFDPAMHFADLGPLPPALREEVTPANAAPVSQGRAVKQDAAGYGRNQNESQGGPVPFATHPAIVRAAAVTALLKADRAGAATVVFTQQWADAPPAAQAQRLPAAVWAYAVRSAARDAAVYLRHLERVVLTPASGAVTRAGIDGLIRSLSDASQPRLAEALRTTFERRFTMALPWNRAGDALPPRNVPGDTSPAGEITLEGENSAQAPPAWASPVLNAGGRLTAVPLWVALAGYALAFAWWFRRRAPVQFDTARGLLLAVPVAGVLVWLLSLGALLSRGWVSGLDVALDAASQSSLLIVGGCAAAGALGLAAGTVSFLAGSARMAPETETPEPEATDTDEPAAAAAVRRYLHTDNPVTSLAEDRLGFSNVVTALADFLDNRGTKPPVVVAINGPWGTGKSSVMHMLAGVLEERQRFRIAWFNAWQYQQEEQLLAAFLKTVAGELSRQWGVLFQLRLAWARLRNASFGQLFMVLLPVALLMFGLLAPETTQAWAERLGMPASGAGGQPGAAALTAKAVALLFGGGGIAMLVRFLYPFRLHYKRLFSAPDVSQQIGFLDEFQQEFRLYREAVGGEKFLIVVDDLDRCHPDAVVEVLKTINLIVNSDDGPGKTFFLLGFDADYIERSIEHAFREFAEAQAGAGGSSEFGRQYLKKIVTVAVSVPVPDPARLQDLARTLGEGGADPAAESGSPRRLWRRFGDWLLGIPAALRQPFPLVVLFLAAFLGFALLQQPPPPAEETPQTATGGSSRAGPATAAGPGDSDARVVSLDATAFEPAADPFGWLLPALEALGLLFLVSAALGVFWSAARNRRAPPEPVDPAAFGEAVIELAAYLPHNPRDLVRLINRMRLDYLLQSGHPDALSAGDCVALTLLREAHPRVLEDEALSAHYLPALDASGDAERSLETTGQSAPEWAAEARQALAELPPAHAALGRPRGLRHFLRMQGRRI